jgi:hypothetical protein
MAFKNPTIDYFSLDVEGSELAILKTIPFDKVDIRVSIGGFFYLILFYLKTIPFDIMAAFQITDLNVYFVANRKEENHETLKYCPNGHPRCKSPLRKTNPKVDVRTVYFIEYLNDYLVILSENCLL